VGVEPATGTLPTTTGPRDPFVDFVRAFSLLVVVAWHWCFTIIIWKPDGPHATNPIGFTDGAWVATWLFQVMPLFFFVGGYANLSAYRAKQRRGAGLWAFVWGRVKQLAVPSLALLGIWVVLGTIAATRYDGEWVWRAVRLVVSPLWFVAVYLLIIVLFPLMHWLHERFGTLVLVWLVGASALVDVARFAHGRTTLALLNMLLVWGFCHQLGFFYEPMVAAGRRFASTLTWGGLFALVALVASNLYPGSMVGVPGERFSNMAPPTLCIVALVVFQSGVALLLRPWVLARLESSLRWARVNEVINRFAMPLFLFHSTGMAIALWIGTRFGFYDKRAPDPGWWLFRPVSFLMPLVCTLPIIFLFGRQWVKPVRTPSRATPG
jgi:fucose 4-O-acetylase-like acetyltransferase